MLSTVKIDWTYDALNRLLTEQRDEGDDGMPNGGDYTDTFGFDLVGNRISRMHDAVGTAQDETVLSTYDGRDRLISADSTNNLNDAIHAYDLNGSTISVTTAGGIAQPPGRPRRQRRQRHQGRRRRHLRLRLGRRAGPPLGDRRSGEVLPPDADQPHRLLAGAGGADRLQA